MNLLLDTHIFLWWLFDDKQLKPEFRDAIVDKRNTVHVSAASVWEIATKYRIGKLPGAEKVAKNVPAWIIKGGFVALPISAKHAQLAGSYPHEHRDPFDRMLAAQASIEQMPLLTEDSVQKVFNIPLFR